MYSDPGNEAGVFIVDATDATIAALVFASPLNRNLFPTFTKLSTLTEVPEVIFPVKFPVTSPVKATPAVILDAAKLDALIVSNPVIVSEPVFARTELLNLEFPNNINPLCRFSKEYWGSNTDFVPGVKYESYL